jgi:DNA-binding response OmpR family regulator
MTNPRAPMPVLLVLNEPLLAKLIVLALNHGTFAVRTAPSAAEGIALLGAWRPRLILLDMELEGVDGARVLAHATPGAPRDRGTPVLGLTRRGDLAAKLRAFDNGVDDIMVVPFSPEELLARALALARRSDPGAGVLSPVIRVGELEIDILRRTVRAGTSELHLTSLEQSLLYFMVANAGRVLTRDNILDALWGADYVAESNVVDRQVRNLRARLQNDWRRPRFIATVPGKGYRFLPNSVAPGTNAAEP